MHHRRKVEGVLMAVDKSTNTALVKVRKLTLLSANDTFRFSKELDLQYLEHENIIFTAHEDLMITSTEKFTGVLQETDEIDDGKYKFIIEIDRSNYAFTYDLLDAQKKQKLQDLKQTEEERGKRSKALKEKRKSTPLDDLEKNELAGLEKDEEAQEELEKEKSKKWIKVKESLQAFCTFTVTGTAIVGFEIAGQVLKLPAVTEVPAGVL
jgi:small nuclear ribonucleoprotein (snRNP)-like protein